MIMAKWQADSSTGYGKTAKDHSVVRLRSKLKKR